MHGITHYILKYKIHAVFREKTRRWSQKYYKFAEKINSNYDKQYYKQINIPGDISLKLRKTY